MLLKSKLSFGMKEIRTLYACTLSGGYEILKLRFIIGCITGLPPELYLTVNGKHVKGKRIIIKERLHPWATLVLPLHPLVKEILQQYDYDLPEIWSDDIEKALETILQKAGIKRPLFRFRVERGKFEFETVPKYKMVKPNMTRAFALQNMKKAGLSEAAIHFAIGSTLKLPSDIEINKEQLLKELFENEYFKQP
jgi:hypothetical protein